MIKVVTAIMEIKPLRDEISMTTSNISNSKTSSLVARCFKNLSQINGKHNVRYIDTPTGLSNVDVIGRMPLERTIPAY